jgi:hypothetical protein
MNLTSLPWIRYVDLTVLLIFGLGTKLFGVVVDTRVWCMQMEASEGRKTDIVVKTLQDVACASY